MFVDTHAHIDYSLFDDDRTAMLERAWTGGVEFIVTIGIDMESCERAIRLADEHEHIFAAVGLHPTDAVKADDFTFRRLEELAGHPKVVAIGETGLDYHWQDSPRDVQETVFRESIRLACRLDLPIIIHNREADTDVIRVLADEKKTHDLQNLRGIMHCFSGDEKMLTESIDLGFYISFAGNLTYKKSRLPDVAARVPLSKMLIETDAPFLPPVPMRGKRNEPAYVIHTAQKLAEVLDVAVEDIGQLTSKNARAVFGIGVK
ncbi:MAG: TatD family hydrolase [Bacteroidetes bacterium]|nr:TatD family hydrolase [Bacteroidota bacterium]